MYSYKNQNRFNYVMKTNRWRQVFIIAAVLLAFFLVFKLAGGGGLDAGNFENQRNARLRSEMQHAASQTNSLSRLGATNTRGSLGLIRQYVHGIEVLNDMNVGMYGEVGRLYPQSVFENLYATIDKYDAKLATGQTVNESLTELSVAIESLNALTTEVLGH